jgi:hypothetical protein
MMVSCSVVGPRPRSGDAVTSHEAEAEVEQGCDSSETEPEVGRDGNLPPRPRPGFGRGGDLLRGRGLRSGEAELLVVPEAELGRGRDLLLFSLTLVVGTVVGTG